MRIISVDTNSTCLLVKSTFQKKKGKHIIQIKRTIIIPATKVNYVCKTEQSCAAVLHNTSDGHFLLQQLEKKTPDHRVHYETAQMSKKICRATYRRGRKQKHAQQSKDVQVHSKHNENTVKTYRCITKIHLPTAHLVMIAAV